MKYLFLFFISIYSNYFFAQCWNDIKANGFNSLGFTNNGKIMIWGSNLYGQLGNGTTNLSNKPIYFDEISSWKDITFSEASCGIKQNGTLWVWGNNNYSNPIPNTSPTQIGIDTDWKKVSARYYHAIALKNDNTLWDLGTGIGNPPIQIGTDNDWKEIITGKNFSFAIKNNGTLWGWGKNDNGQLGDGTYTDKTLPVQIGSINNWKKISTSDDFVFAITNDGTLWGWGGGWGTNYITPVDSPIPGGWKDISTLNGGGLLLNNSGKLYSLGVDYYGGLGTGSGGFSTFFYEIDQSFTPNNNWAKISSGSGHTLALKENGELWGFGFNDYGSVGNGIIGGSSPYAQKISCSTTLESIEIGYKNFKIYPNPTKDKIYFKDLKNISKVNIYDVQGRLIKTSFPKDNYTDLLSFNNGIYIIEVFADGKSYKARLVKN